jgi:hypothetical protein
MLKENINYELVPSDGDDDAWNVRILTGDYTETVFQFGAISINGEDHDEDASEMTFNFDVISSPDNSLDPETDIGLQNHVGDILLSILEKAIENNELVTKEVDG